MMLFSEVKLKRASCTIGPKLTFLKLFVLLRQIVRVQKEL